MLHFVSGNICLFHNFLIGIKSFKPVFPNTVAIAALLTFGNSFISVYIVKFLFTKPAHSTV